MDRGPTRPCLAVCDGNRKQSHPWQRSATPFMPGRGLSSGMEPVGRHLLVSQHRCYLLLVCPVEAQSDAAVRAEVARCRDHLDPESSHGEDLLSTHGVGSGMKQYDAVLGHAIESPACWNAVAFRQCRTCWRPGQRPASPSVQSIPGKYHKPAAPRPVSPEPVDHPAQGTPRRPA